MKFFVTGRSSRIPEVEATMERIIELGHEVTFEWPKLPMVKPYEENVAAAADFASQAIKGIIEADVYILLAHEDGNGVFTELGAALAARQMGADIKIYAVAEAVPAAMFHYHPAILWRDNLEQVIKEVSQ